MLGVIRNIFQMNGCIFVYLKCFIEKIAIVNDLYNIPPLNVIISTFTWILSVLVFMLLIVIYITFGSFKFLVAVYLQYRHGSDSEMLRYGDNNYVGDITETQHIIHLLMLMKFDGSKDSFADYARDICKKKMTDMKRLTSVRMTFLGCQYLLHNQVGVDDILTSMKFGNDAVCNYQTLCKFLQSYYHTPLPKKNTATFQMIAGEEPVEFDDSTTNEKLYPLLLRVHHSVCDGLTLISFFERMTEGNESINTVHSTNGKKSNFVLKDLFKWKANNVPLLIKRDNNVLKIPKLSEDTNIAFRVETSNEYMQKVKTIRNSVPNGSFAGVLLAALSAALCKHFKKYDKEIPDDIIALVPTVPDIKLLRSTHKSLKNIFTPALVRVPLKIAYSDKNSEAFDRLRKSTMEYSKLMGSLDVFISHWIVKIFSDINPMPVLKYMVSLYDVSTVMLSSMPATKRIRILGHDLKYVIPFVPLIYTVGLGICLVTYGGRFQISICADAKVVPEQAQVEEILDEMLSYVDELHEDILARQRLLQ